MEKCKGCFKHGILRGHIGSYDHAFDNIYGACPHDPKTYRRCLCCKAPISKALIHCHICSVKYRCRGCDAVILQDCPAENMTIRKCMMCAIFYTCDLCGGRKHSSHLRTRCTECSRGSIICRRCGDKCAFNTLTYPWGKYILDSCLRCVDVRVMGTRRLQIAWIMQKHRGVGLLKIVMRLYMTSVCEVSFNDALRLYLIFEWQHQCMTVGRRVMRNGGSRHYRAEPIPPFWVTKLDLFKRYLGNRAAADVKLAEGVDCDYVFIYFMRWLPQDIILKILSYV
jgi:hypothetical protein